MGPVRLKKLHLFAIFLFVCYLAATWGYRMIFIGELQYGSDFGTRYGDLLLTDTIEYYNFSKAAGADWLKEVLADGVKNYLGPVLLIRLMGNMPFGDLMINSLLMLCSTIVLIGLLEHLDVRRPWALVLLLCNPAVFIFSQGFNKEIPLILCTLLFAFSIVRRYRALSMLAILMTFVFRTQIALFFMLFFLFQLFYERRGRNGIFIWLLSVPVAFLFPLFYGKFARVFLESGDLYYAAGTGSGIGRVVTNGLLNIPFFAYIGLPIHAAQNILEPTLVMKIDSVHAVLSSLSAILITPFFAILFAQVLFNIFSGRLNRSKYYSVALHLMVVFAILFVSINPFIHSRYLFCFLPLLPLAVKRGSILLFGSAHAPLWETNKWQENNRSFPDGE